MELWENFPVGLTLKSLVESGEGTGNSILKGKDERESKWDPETCVRIIDEGGCVWRRQELSGQAGVLS